MSIPTTSGNSSSYYSQLMHKFAHYIPKLSLNSMKSIFQNHSAAPGPVSQIKNPSDITLEVRSTNKKIPRVRQSTSFEKPYYSFTNKCLGLLVIVGVASSGVRSRMDIYENSDNLFNPDNPLNNGTLHSFNGQRNLLSIEELGTIETMEQTELSITEVTTNVFGTFSGGLTVSVKALNGSNLPEGLTLTNNQIQLISTYSSACFPMYYLNENLICGYSQFNPGTVLSVSDINNPTIVGALQLPLYNGLLEIACKTTNLCYFFLFNTLTQTESLQVVDISQFPQINTLKTDSTIQGGMAALANQNGVIISNNNVISFLNITDPYNPKVAAQITVPITSAGGFSEGYAFDIGDEYFCLGDNVGNLKIYDVKNISHPILIGSDKVKRVNQGDPAIQSIVLQSNSQGTFCIVNAYNNGIQIFNITNPANRTITNIIGDGNNFQTMIYANNLFYLNGPNRFFQMNLQDYLSPILISTAIVPFVGEFLSESLSLPYRTIESGQVKVAAISNLYYFYTDLLRTYIIPRGQTFTISGTSAGGTEGNSTFQLIAENVNGTIINNDAYFNLIIQPCLVVNGVVTFPQAVVGTPVSFFIPQGSFSFSNSFPQANQGEITLSATLGNGDPLPKWLVFDSQSATFLGTPPRSGVGSLGLVVKANYKGSTAEIRGPFNVVYGPSLTAPLPSQIAEVGVPFSYTLPNNFADEDGVPFAVVLSNLPLWLNISYSNNQITLSGTPTEKDLATLNLPVQVNAANGVSITTTQVIEVLLPGTPRLQSPMQDVDAEPRTELIIQFPENMFVDDEDGSSLPIEVTGYPSWMTYNSVTRTLRGTPGDLDVGTTTNNKYEVTATSTSKANISNIDTFTITVQGNTVLDWLLKIVPATLAGAGLIYRNRVWLYNKIPFFQRFYREEAWNARVGEKATPRVITALRSDQLKDFQAFKIREKIEFFSICGKKIKKPKWLTSSQEALAGGRLLPPYMRYDPDTNALVTDVIPEGEENERYKIFLRNHGYNKARFNFIVQNSKEAVNSISAKKSHPNNQVVADINSNSSQPGLATNISSIEMEAKEGPSIHSNSSQPGGISSNPRQVVDSVGLSSNEIQLVSINSDQLLSAVNHSIK